MGTIMTPGHACFFELFFFQGEVAQSAARYNLLLGSRGAKDRTSSRLQNDGRRLRI